MQPGFSPWSFRRAYLELYFDLCFDFLFFNGSETKNVIISTFPASMNNIVLFIPEAQRLERD